MPVTPGEVPRPTADAPEGPDTRRDVTRLLAAHHAGDRSAFDRLVPLVYDDLRRIARGVLGRSRRGVTISPTVLVHEAYFQLVDANGVSWQGRAHFFAVAARAMRRVLVDFARRRCAAKRGGGAELVPLDFEPAAVALQAETLLAIDRALDGLTALDERLVAVVECRLFGGLTEDETARALGASLRTVQRDWQRGRAWLARELPPSSPAR